MVESARSARWFYGSSRPEGGDLRSVVTMLWLVLAVIFAPSVAALTGVAFLGYTDEVAIVVLAVRAIIKVQRTPLRAVPGTWLFLVFLGAGTFGAVQAQVSSSVLLLTFFSMSKLFLLTFAAMQENWTDAAVRILEGFLGRLLVVAGGFGLLNLAVGEVWTRAFERNGSSYIDVRFGFIASQGLFVHPLEQSAILVLLLGAGVAAYQTLGASRRRAWSLALGFGALFVTFRRSGWLLSVIGTLTALRRWAVGYVAATAWAAAIGVLLLWGPLAQFATKTYDEYFTHGATSARGLLLRGAVTGAEKNFPLGYGFGTYGSAASLSGYSEAYAELGFQYVWGLQDATGYGSFLLDSQWANVLGETGVIGAVCFAGWFIWQLVVLRRLNTGDPLSAWLSRSARSMIISIVILSAVGTYLAGSPALGVLGVTLGAAAGRIAHDRRSEPSLSAPELQRTT